MSPLCPFTLFTLFLYRLNEKGIAKSQPEATAELILFFLSHKPVLYEKDEVKKIWLDLQQGQIDDAKLAQIREGLASLGQDPET